VKRLTLKHPWPWAILVMGKRIENRCWSPSMRPGERFAVHGGKVPTGDDLMYTAAVATDILARFGLPGGILDVTLADVIRPGIVAVVTFRGVVYRSDDPWFEGPRGWLFDDVTPVEPAFQCRGSQGLWDAPEGFAPPLRAVGTEVARA